MQICSLFKRLSLRQGYAEFDAFNKCADVVRMGEILGVNHGLSQGIIVPQAQVAPTLRVENRRDDEDYAIRALLFPDHASLRAVRQIAAEDQLDVRVILTPVGVLGVYHRRYLRDSWGLAKSCVTCAYALLNRYSPR